MKDLGEIRGEVRACLEAGNISGLREALGLTVTGPEDHAVSVNGRALTCLMEAAFDRNRVTDGGDSRESDLNHEMEVQAGKLRSTLEAMAELEKKFSRLVTKNADLQDRIDLLGRTADIAVKETSDALREVLAAVAEDGEPY